MADEIYIAKEESVQEINTKIGVPNDAGSNNTMSTTMSIFAKLNYLVLQVNSYLSTIYSRIGAPNDTESNSTTGTTVSIFAKLNYLVSQVSSYLGNIFSWIGSPSTTANNSASANAHAKLNWFLNLFGKTNDTGGSDTAGTVMGKLNSLIKASAIKSIQRGLLYAEGSTLTTTIPIASVNPSKCFIILDCGSQYETKYGGVYLDSLTATSMTIKRAANINHNCSWQVIEFN